MELGSRSRGVSLEKSKPEWEKWLQPLSNEPAGNPGEIPPPEKRLCVYHNRPISERDWRLGHRSTECTKCKNERAGRTPKRHHNKADGTRRPKSLRQDYKRSVEKRKEGLANGNTLSGLELFERSTGFKIS